MFNPKDHMTNLRGKDYLEVKWRIVWFRDAHPAGRIATEIIRDEPLIVRATVFSADGLMMATGHGSANAGGRKVVWTGREIEKAETAAIGRALAHAGFGTQFTGEDEEDHIADSPVEKKPAQKKPAQKKPAQKATADTRTPPKWKPAAIAWMVDDKIATNSHNAAAIWDLVDGNDCADKGVFAKRVQLYRRWRDETDAEAQVAATHAIAGNEPA